GYFNGSCTTAF
ncbi:acrB/AcrD/AcrF family protein, partial [Vibrio parahaemolyticus VPTS-2010_2]